jgi:hypothetical protein
VRTALERAEQLAGAQRRAALSHLGTQLNGGAAGARDPHAHAIGQPP